MDGIRPLLITRKETASHNHNIVNLWPTTHHAEVSIHLFMLKEHVGLHVK